jgi:hypothetical protein
LGKVFSELWLTEFIFSCCAENRLLIIIEMQYLYLGTFNQWSRTGYEFFVNGFTTISILGKLNLRLGWVIRSSFSNNLCKEKKINRGNCSPQTLLQKNSDATVSFSLQKYYCCPRLGAPVWGAWIGHCLMSLVRLNGNCGEPASVFQVDVN